MGVDVENSYLWFAKFYLSLQRILGDISSAVAGASLVRLLMSREIDKIK